MQYEFGHPLYMHGAEDQHPGSKPEEFGAILICHNQEFIITANERSYLAFLLHDASILETQRIGVHPFWLGNEENGSYYAQHWLTILEIQALHEASKDPELFEVYWETLIENMQRGRSSEAFAINKINTKFKNIMSMIDKFNKNAYVPAALEFEIERRISALYNQIEIANDTDKINSILNPNRKKFTLS